MEDEGLNGSVIPGRCSHRKWPDGVSPFPQSWASPWKMQALVMLLAAGGTCYLGLLAAVLQRPPTLANPTP